jgi:peroxiredoxin
MDDKYTWVVRMLFKNKIMITKKFLPALLIISALAIGGWLYKKYKMVPTLPAYENSFTNEQGQTVNISDYKGKYVLVSYFQTWCGDCIRELPSIEMLQNKIGPDKLKVLMVTDESTEKINHFKEKFNCTFDYYQSKSFREQNINVFPTTYLLNKDGVVIISKLEGFDWSGDDVIKKLKD